MRNAFVHTLMNRAKIDEDIILITGDLGYSVLESFQQQYPDRFINAGIAEQNMTGLAAGLALAGKKPFTYSIANFPTLRCLEQIRNDICLHNARVTIVSVGSGFSYGAHGYTHHGVEDVTVMRVLPNMQVFCPADPVETQWILDSTLQNPRPCYIRLAKGDSKLHQNLEDYRVPQMIPLIQGKNKTILSTGIITQDLLTFAMEKNRYNLYSVPVIKPLDMESLARICNQSELLITVEEHQLNGGFGSAIIESIIELKNKNLIEKIPTLFRLGIDDQILLDYTTDIFSKKIIDKINQLSVD